MGKRWHYWAICTLIVALSAAAARYSGNIRFFHLVHLKALDAQFVARGRQPTSNIVLLVADQKAFDTFTDLTIFWHRHYADAIRAAGASGARVIGLDLAFAVPVEKWEPGHDQALAEAVSSSPAPVVCGYVAAMNTHQGKFPVPVNMLAAAMGLAGYSNMTSDADDFVRKQEIIEAPDPNAPSEPPARSLAMRVAEKYLSAEAEFRDGRILLGGQPIPTVADRTIAINFAGGPDTFPRVSLADFLEAARLGDTARLRRWVEGKIVLVGTDAAGIDRFATPFFTMFSGPRWTTAGVEVHASTVRTIVDRRFLQSVDARAEVAALVASALVTAAIVLSLNALPAALCLLAWIVALGALTQVLFRAGWILSWSELMLAVVLSFVGAGVYRFVTTARRGALFRKAVSVFVGDQVATSLDQADEIALSGRRLTVTILFTDIRGFTAFTEKVCQEQGPETVVEMLNDYMEQMVAIVVAHSGHVNKFIGDGILAMFSDEDKGAAAGDHALRAVRCATAMVTAPSRFQTGAGLHTGQAVVGNVGSSDKMEFTVLGDTVNLASRLESLNKEKKTRLLMSGETESELRGQVETVRLADVAVRGKSDPIQLYTVAALVRSEREEAAPASA